MSAKVNEAKEIDAANDDDRLMSMNSSRSLMRGIPPWKDIIMKLNAVSLSRFARMLKLVRSFFDLTDGESEQ
jgi:hypothetical protein